jgi:hypothetical protein
MALLWYSTSDPKLDAISASADRLVKREVENKTEDKTDKWQFDNGQPQNLIQIQNNLPVKSKKGRKVST